MTVVGYPTPAKDKARVILDSFCGGAGGSVCRTLPARLLPGAAAFYGVTAATKYLWDQARAEKRDVWYLDNAYFDKTRQVYFRATINRLQHPGTGTSDGKRFASLGIQIAEPQPPGKHVLVCPQSDPFMAICAEYPGSWLKDTVAALKKLTKREIRVRPWQSDKKAWFKTLPDDLKDCHALVTYSSSSAITAMLAGVPAFVTATDSIAVPVANLELEQIETPHLPPDLLPWCRIVADNQWRLDEMRSGLAWQKLNDKLCEGVTA